MEVKILNLLQIINFIAPLGWLAAILLYRLKYGIIKIKWVRLGIVSAFLAFSIFAAYCTAETYNLWKNDPVSRYLLPPYQPTYFYTYSLYHYWLPLAANFLTGSVWFCFLYALNKIFKESLMEKNEIWLAFFGAMVVGWPNFILYLFVILGMFLLHQIIANFIYKTGRPISIAPHFIAGALAILIFGNFLIRHFGLEVLKI